jgi:hypothetical protein
MLQARYRPRFRRLAIATAVALVAAVSALSVGASESQATFSLSGGCWVHENFCTEAGGGDGAPSGTGWGGSGSGGWGAGGGTLTEIRRGTTTCHMWNGEPFDCEYSDYRTPTGGTIRQCYWSEGGVRRHSIPCE